MKRDLVIAALVILTGCSAKVDIKSTSAEPAAPASGIPGPEASTDDMLSSLLRVSDRIITVCYDGLEDNKNQFLIKYKPAEGDDYGEGWVYVKDQPFFLTSSGKWFTQAPVRDAFVRVYPDIDGLPCKSN